MARAQASASRDGDIILMVGTMKGLFTFRSRDRKRWTRTGPEFRGNVVYSTAVDQRNGTARLWASSANPFFGANLAHSDDMGKTWTTPAEPAIKFPSSSGMALKNIWQIHAPAHDPSRLWAGVEPAALFESRDNGRSWDPVIGLLEHDHRVKWNPGAGGLCLHTIVTDPQNPKRMLIAISAAGVYRTDDGGRSWRPRNVGVRAEFLPDKYPEFGQCVHKVVHHPSAPGTLFLQNHWGLYTSTDWGETWKDMAHGVPSDFGFAMAMHPHDPRTVYILPIESDMFRCVPEAKLRVYRTTDGGKSWKALTKGLPQKDAFETVLRDAMTTDQCATPGVYFGTRSGKLYASANEGDSWTCLADALPSITTVRATTLRPNGAAAKAPHRKAAARHAGRKTSRSARTASRGARARK